MDATGDAAPARAEDDEADNEMPLLFMDGLPSDFQRNAQLAALLTLMPSDDDHADDPDDDDDDADDDGRDAPRAARRRRAMRRETREPYARAAAGEAKPTPQPAKKRRQPKATGAQELALYLSMFTVSKD